MEIRRLKDSDVDAFWRLRRLALETHSEAFGESVDEHDAKTPKVPTEPDQFILGAFAGERLVGSTGVYREARAKRRHRAWIWGVFVDEAFRGRGAAKRLISEAVREAREMPGIICVVLTVTSSEPGARALYLGQGFQSCGVEPKALCVDGRLIEEEHMVLEL